MKSLTWLLDCVLSDMSIRCSTDTHLDSRTLKRRIKHEGQSFLTIALPNFGSDFEKSLDRGWVGSDVFIGYKKTAGLPAFLRGFLNQVFDPFGRLLEEPSLECILAVRQLCLMFKKIDLPCKTNRERKALDGYLRVEHELTGSSLARRIDRRLCDHNPVREDQGSESSSGIQDEGKVRDYLRCHLTGSSLLDDLAKCSGVLWGAALSGGLDFASVAIATPKHGPGATQERLLANRKYDFSRWHSRLNRWFPPDQFWAASPDWLGEGAVNDRLELVMPRDERPVRVAIVPKTQKAPRIIAVEPVCNQYTQQSLLPLLVKIIEGGRYSSGHVNFSDQGINRMLAQESSRNGKFATMDLSEASDRVSAELVARMFRWYPEFVGAIFSCRSRSASLPDGRTIRLRKFASMGSALCFPIEAMVFYTIMVLCRLHRANLSITPRNCFKVSRSLYVYGDDLIIPADEVEAIAVYLELFDLKVNRAKTFGAGRFRESCGMDAYAGVDVTPVYVRTMPPRNRHQASELVSYVSLANQLYQRGWWVTARRVREWVESVLRTELPHVQESSPCLGWHSVDKRFTVSGWDSEHQRFQVHGFVEESHKYHDPLQGHGALMKCFLTAERKLSGVRLGHLFPEPIDKRHLRRSVRPDSVSIECRWACPY